MAKANPKPDIATLRADLSAAEADERARRDELRLQNSRLRPFCPRPIEYDLAELRHVEAVEAVAQARWRLERELYHALPAHAETVALLEDARVEVAAIGKLDAAGKHEEARERQRRLRQRIDERRIAHNEAITAANLYGKWWALPGLNGRLIGELVAKLAKRFAEIDTPPPEPARLAHMRRDLEARKADQQRIWELAEEERQARAAQARRDAERAERQRVEAAAAKAKRREEHPPIDLGAERRKLAAAWDARHGANA